MTVNSWMQDKLGKFITLQRGYDLPSYNRKSGNVPVVTSAGISGTHSEAKERGPGVVMGRYGTIGQIYYVEEDYWPHNTSLFVKDFRGNHPKFVYYFLHTLHYQEHNDKSTVPGLNRNHLHIINVQFPPIEEQHAIAEILSSLDDKIELNRRMNETLEEIAHAIFKSWFVDFDPVHVKARGETPIGMDEETAALFPCSFEESKLGFIPSGWRIEKIGKHVNAMRGLSYKGEFLADKGLPMHNLNSVYEGGGYKHEGIKFYSGEYQARHIINAGDLIVTNTEQGHDLLLIGYPALIPAKYKQGIFSHHTYKVVPKHDSPLSRVYLYQLLLTRKMHTILGGYTNGTTVNMLPDDAFELPKVIIPDALVVKRFDEIISPLLDKIEANIEENSVLAETRDALLPKLVSGEIRV